MLHTPPMVHVIGYHYEKQNTTIHATTLDDTMPWCYHGYYNWNLILEESSFNQKVSFLECFMTNSLEGGICDQTFEWHFICHLAESPNGREKLDE